MNLKIILISLFLLITMTAFAQKARLERANKYFQEGNYEKSAKQCEKILYKIDDVNTKELLSISYLHLGNFDDAEFWLSRLVHNPEMDADYKLFYAACLCYNKRCEFGKNWLEAYEKEAYGDKRIPLLKFYLDRCEISKSELQNLL
jgi:Tfp pilus assembly protein PilF